MDEDDSQHIARILVDIANKRFSLDDETNYIVRARLQSKIDANFKALDSFRDTNKSYQLKVVEMYHDYEEMVFNLSEQSKNETIQSIKMMSLGQRLKFQELISRRNSKLKTPVSHE